MAEAAVYAKLRSVSVSTFARQSRLLWEIPLAVPWCEKKAVDGAREEDSNYLEVLPAMGVRHFVKGREDPPGCAVGVVADLGEDTLIISSILL